MSQIFVVAESEEEKQAMEQQDELPHGITPPNTNVVKRKYEKTKRYTPFPVGICCLLAYGVNC